MKGNIGLVSKSQYKTGRGVDRHHASCIIIINRRIVGDVAVPVSARQVVLFCALRSPDERPILNILNIKLNR